MHFLCSPTRRQSQTRGQRGTLAGDLNVRHVTGYVSGAHCGEKINYTDTDELLSLLDLYAIKQRCLWLFKCRERKGNITIICDAP